MNHCVECGKPIPKDGWGAVAMRLDSSGYIHYACLKPPDPPPDPAPLYALPLPNTRADTHAEDHISIRQAAHLLGLSQSTIRARIRAGWLPAKRLRHTQTIRLSRAVVLDQLQDIDSD